MSLLCPDVIYCEGELKFDWAIEIDDGQIAWVGPRSQRNEPHQRLAGQALLPGFVNSHSHAFQRVFRGATEFRSPEHPHDDFWSWRELMYQAALQLSPEGVEAVARQVFLEMLESGITTVGEFHYLHHAPDGSPYSDPDELARRVIAAAHHVGLGIVLLRTAYHRSGFSQPPNPRQRRFLDRSLDDCLQAVERLRRDGIACGVAPHSVRAVPRAWLIPLADYARSHRLPLQMHVSEQPREIDECLGEYGLRPVDLLAEDGILGDDFTGVHLIHLSPGEIEKLGKSGSNLCSCPTTERNLGDGIVPVEALMRSGVSFTLGTDSQCQIDPMEDARQLEYHARLQARQRAVLDLHSNAGLARRLLDCTSLGGGRSLRQPIGEIAVGKRADLVSIDLHHPALLGYGDLLARIVFALPQGAIRQVYQAGQPRLQEGRHPAREAVARDFQKVLRSLH